MGARGFKMFCQKGSVFFLLALCVCRGRGGGGAQVQYLSFLTDPLLLIKD